MFSTESYLVVEKMRLLALSGPFIKKAAAFGDSFRILIYYF